jgi:hypothetical protein
LMKLGKTTRWALLIGIVAVLLVTLGVMYSRQKEEEGKLTASISQAQQSYTLYSQQTAKYEGEKSALEAKLREANSRVAAAKDKLRHQNQSIEINRILFEAAHDATVIIRGLSSSPPHEEELDGVSYEVFSIDVSAQAQGREIASLLNFSHRISDSFPTGAIESVGITVPAKGEGEAMPAINLQLKIYAYKGE